MVMCLQSDVSTKLHSRDKDCFPHRLRYYGFFLFVLFLPDLNYVIQTSQLSQSVSVLLWVNWIFNGTLICLKL